MKLGALLMTGVLAVNLHVGPIRSGISKTQQMISGQNTSTNYTIKESQKTQTTENEEEMALETPEEIPSEVADIDHQAWARSVESAELLGDGDVDLDKLKKEAEIESLNRNNREPKIEQHPPSGNRGGAKAESQNPPPPPGGKGEEPSKGTLGECNDIISTDQATSTPTSSKSPLAESKDIRNIDQPTTAPTESSTKEQAETLSKTSDIEMM